MSFYDEKGRLVGKDEPICAACGDWFFAGHEGDGGCSREALMKQLDEARRKLSVRDCQALNLANALDLAHRPLHPEALDSCDVCRLLERARRWGQ